MYRPKLSISSTRLLRTFNVVSVLKILYKEVSCSRARLAEVTQMSQATITRIIIKLIEQGFIVEERLGDSNGGRRPIIFRLNYEQLFTVGIQILREQSVIAIIGIKGKIYAKRVFYQISLEPESLIKQLAKELEILLQESQVVREYILGVGLAISGVIDRERGILHKSINLGWQEVKVVELLESLIELPVYIENDANAGAIAEIWLGDAKNISSLLYLKAFSGIGAGIVSEGKLLSGIKGMSGEIGHISVISNGKHCHCGQDGCLETYLHLPDLLKQYEKETGRSLNNSQDLFTLAFGGDSVAKSYINEAIEALAKAITFVVLLLDLELIIIGGIWGEIGKQFTTLVTARVTEIMKDSRMDRRILVKQSSLGMDADLLVATGLVIDEWFAPPICAN